MSKDLRDALRRLRWFPVYCLPGALIPSCGGNWWSLLFFCILMGLCIMVGLLMAMLFPIRGCRWSLKERIGEIRRGVATI